MADAGGSKDSLMERDPGLAAPAPLDETLDAEKERSPSGPSLSRRSDGLPPLDRDGRRRLIESPASDQPDLVPVDPEHYVYGYELARGGMGRIVAARDRRLGRVVAIKELIQHTPDRAARFEREAFITARLQHPAIVNLHEAGRWPSGQPFYTMKLVSGRSLAQMAGEVRPLSERLGLLPNLIAMVEAVAYAHRQRIIHRDLKPSNVLIGDLGETVVIDWGLAKDLAGEPDDVVARPCGTDDTLEAHPALDGRERGSPATGPGRPATGSGGGIHTGSLTIAGSVMGTPGYMPPEQAEGKDVDERADVYALGAILYHTLGGAEPYKGTSADLVLAAVLAGPPAPLAQIEPRLAQDLVTIVEKAMARQQGARYPTAVELAEDLRRFQTGQLVGAHRYSRRELLWRFAVRHRAWVFAGLAALVAIAVIAQVSFQRVIAERDRAEAAGQAAMRRADELAVAQAGSLLDNDPGAALDLLARLSPDSTPATWRLAHMVASDARLRGIPRLLRGHDGPLEALDLSPGGDVLVSADLHTVRVWDLKSGNGRAVGRQDALIYALAVSPDGRSAVTASLDSRLRLWSLASGGVVELGNHEGAVGGLRFLPDGQRLVSAGADGAVRLWRVTGGHEPIGQHEGQILDLSLSEDGTTLASVGEDRVVRVWRLGQRAPVREMHLGTAGFNRVALSPDGSRVAASGTQRQVWVWQVASGNGRELTGHDQAVWAIDFSPDGRRLASGGEDHTIRLWDVETGESEVLRDHTGEVVKLRFARGSDLLLSVAEDGTVRVWTVDGRSASAVQVLAGHDSDVKMDVSDDGRVAVTSDGSRLRRWNIGAASATLRGHRGQVTQVEFARSGAVVSAGGDWIVRLWPPDPQAGAPRVMRGHQSTILALAVSPDGRLAASADQHRSAWLWDLARGSGRALRGRVFAQPRFSPDGALLAAPSEDYTLRLWSTATPESRVLRGHTSWVTAVAFSPDGRTLASGAADRTVRLWDFATGSGRLLEGHTAAVRYVEFSGPGRLVSSDLAGSVREWDVATGSGRELGRAATGVAALAATPTGDLVAWATVDGEAHLWNRRSGTSRVLPRREKSIAQLIFSPDGRTLLGRDSGSRVLLWDTETDAVLVLPSHGRTIADFAISPDGRQIATADSDRSVRLWPYDLPYEPTALRDWLTRAAR